MSRSWCVPLHSPAFRSAICGLAIIATLGTASAEQPDPNSVVVRVNGVDIREADLAIAAEDVGRSLASYDEAARRDYLVKYVTDIVLMSKAARDQRIGDEADLQRRMAFVRDKALTEALLQATAQKAVTDESVRRAYDEAIAASPPKTEYRLRNILLRFGEGDDKASMKIAEGRAAEALKRISKGEDFAVVAAAMSDTPAAKSNGGDLGYQTIDEMGKEYAESIATLKLGQVSPIIRTSFGLHIVKLDDQRTRKPIAFEEVRERFKELVGSRAQAELVTRLRSQAKIETPARDREPSTDAAAR